MMIVDIIIIHSTAVLAKRLLSENIPIQQKCILFFIFLGGIQHMTNTEVFANRLKALRIENKLSQKELADKLGITAQSLSLYEKAERTINLDLLVKISDFFGVSCDFLSGLSDIKSYNANVQAAVKYTGLSEKAIDKIITMNKAELSYSNLQKEDLFIPDDITSKYKSDFLSYLLECNAMSHLFSRAFDYAIQKINIEATIDSCGKNRFLDDQNEYTDFRFMKLIKEYLGDHAISYCKEKDIISEYGEERKMIYEESNK